MLLLRYEVLHILLIMCTFAPAKVRIALACMLSIL